MEDQDLLSTIASLKNAVENIVNDYTQDEDENDIESNENCILDVDGLIDETLILEVQFVLCNVENIRIFPNKIFPQCSKRSDVNVSLSQVRLKNAETLSDNLKRKSKSCSHP